MQLKSAIYKALENCSFNSIETFAKRIANCM